MDKTKNDISRITLLSIRGDYTHPYILIRLPRQTWCQRNYVLVHLLQSKHITTKLLKCLMLRRNTVASQVHVAVVKWPRQLEVVALVVHVSGPAAPRPSSFSAFSGATRNDTSLHSCAMSPAALFPADGRLSSFDVGFRESVSLLQRRVSEKSAETSSSAFPVRPNEWLHRSG